MEDCSCSFDLNAHIDIHYFRVEMPPCNVHMWSERCVRVGGQCLPSMQKLPKLCHRKVVGGPLISAAQEVTSKKKKHVTGKKKHAVTEPRPLFKGWKKQRGVVANAPLSIRCGISGREWESH